MDTLQTAITYLALVISFIGAGIAISQRNIASSARDEAKRSADAAERSAKAAEKANELSSKLVKIEEQRRSEETFGDVIAIEWARDGIVVQNRGRSGADGVVVETWQAADHYTMKSTVEGLSLNPGDRADARRLQMEPSDYTGADKEIDSDGYRAQWRDQDGTIRSNGWAPLSRRR